MQESASTPCCVVTDAVPAYGTCRLRDSCEISWYFILYIYILYGYIYYVSFHLFQHQVPTCGRGMLWLTPKAISNLRRNSNPSCPRLSSRETCNAKNSSRSRLILSPVSESIKVSPQHLLSPVLRTMQDNASVCILPQEQVDGLQSELENVKALCNWIWHVFFHCCRVFPKFRFMPLVWDWSHGLWAACTDLCQFGGWPY